MLHLSSTTCKLLSRDLDLFLLCTLPCRKSVKRELRNEAGTDAPAMLRLAPHDVCVLGSKRELRPLADLTASSSEVLVQRFPEVQVPRNNRVAESACGCCMGNYVSNLGFRSSGNFNKSKLRNASFDFCSTSFLQPLP